MGDGWAWVSLSAHSNTIPAEQLEAKLPGAKLEPRNRTIASVNFSEDRGESSLSELLSRLSSYLIMHREQLLNLAPDAEFQVRIGWSPASPQESLVVSAQLISALAELNFVIMLDGYGTSNLCHSPRLSCSRQDVAR